MKTTITKTYTCEICGNYSQNKDQIESCELDGVEEKLAKIGDVIYFQNNGKTRGQYFILGGDNYEETEYRLNAWCRECIMPFEIFNVKFDGHRYLYFLVPILSDGRRVGDVACFRVNNKEIQLILNEYNKDRKESLCTKE